MRDRKKLAIFDMDGTLFDTKNVNYTAYNKALELCGFNVDISYKFYCEFCSGNSYKTFLPQVVKGVTMDEMQVIHKKKKQLYAEYLNMARMNENLFAMIDVIRIEYIIALVTTASRKNVDDILNKFNVADRFDFLITQEDVERMKPDPECFIKAIKKAGVGKKDTIIFEDSEAGLRAAELSGAQYVKVYGYN